jgi:hypothetical protein
VSVEIRCDRCAKSTKGYFVNAEIQVRRGVFASFYSKLSAANSAANWSRHWQLCEDCTASLKRWTEPGTKVVYEIEVDEA